MPGFDFSSAGGGAGLAADAGSRGELLPLQPAGLVEFERRFGAENRVTKLCRAGILRQNSGKGCLVVDEGLIEIIHNRAPLFRGSSAAVFLSFDGIIHGKP